MLVEGGDEIALALAAEHQPLTVLKAPELVKRDLPALTGEIIQVTPAVFRKLSARENPDGWLALFRTPRVAFRGLQLGANPLLVVVEAVEKPGNLGAILRTCDAAGVSALVVCDPRADVYGPNVVRASRGTVFSVPIVVAAGDETRRHLREKGIRIAAASPSGQISYTRADLSGPLAIAVGTEDRGLSQNWIAECDTSLQIPMRGRVNSLNVSVATALLIYEAVRQRGG